MASENIILTGFMGSGKSRIGQELSEKLGVPVLDTDQLIVEKEGMSINDIFARRGQPYFRDLETQLLRDLAERKDRYILSVGGGMPLREENRPLLKKLGRVIYLSSSLDTLEKRLIKDKSRPNLRGEGSLRERISALLEERMPMYMDAAELIIENDQKSASIVADEILAAVSQAEAD